MSETIQLQIQGMHCADCAFRIERHLRELGARDASVDLVQSTARFSLDSSQPGQTESETLAELGRAIERMGYRVTLSEGRGVSAVHSVPTIPFLHSLWGRFIICAVLTTPLLLHMVFNWQPLHSPYVQLVLSAPVYLIGLWHFGAGALGSIRRREPNMDVLILIGASASFGYSVIGTLLALGPQFLFYESTATIITFVLLGNLLERGAIRRTTAAIEELGHAQITTAKRITVAHDALVPLVGRGRTERHPGPDGTRNDISQQNQNIEETFDEIDARQIGVDDRLLVNSGDRIPADGLIYWGRGAADESILSGESTPVEKTIDNTVIGGSTLVDGSIKIRATKVGEESVLAQIVRMVRAAQAKPPQIQRIGDRVSAIFVPAVLVFAIATLPIAVAFFGIAFPNALLNAIAVLVIACPCAMGLATPAAVMVGVGAAVRRGILVRNGSTLERLAQVRKIVFDKTGTLTTGALQVKTVVAFAGRSEDEVRSILLALEQHSSHPIARAIVAGLDASAGHPLDLRDVAETGGVGIRGITANGDIVEVGSYALVSAPRAAAADPDAASLDAAVPDGHNVYVLKNGSVIGWVDLEDQVRAESREIVSRLHALGIATALLSGDRQARCETLAREVGIEEVYCEKLPEQKLAIIEELQRTMPLAYVGDGINDAPALARATVGVSLGSASNLAIQSAEVVLLNEKLKELPTAVAIARKTLRVIKENLFWAFFYNILAIPFAAAGMLTPTLAAFSMIFSDLVVVLNSLRLRWSARQA